MKEKRSDRPRSSARRKLLPFALLAILILLIYGRTIGYDFSYCDDYRIIVQQHDRIDDLSDLGRAFTRGFGGLYRPVLQMSWVLDAQRGGTSPGAYHLSNILFHMLASWLLYVVLVSLRLPRRIALSLALVFSAHPLLVEAVAWIPGRNDSLVAVFVLASFLCLIHLTESWRYGLFFLHLFFLALALATKETAAMFPLLALVFLWWKRKLALSPVLRLVAGWVSLGVVWFIFRRVALSGYVSSDVVGIEAFKKSFPALPALLGKAVIPWKLSGLATFEAFSIISGMAVLVALVLLTAITERLDRRAMVFGSLWFLLFLLPTFFYRVANADDHFEYLEHRAYLPLIGLLLIVADILVKRGISFHRKSSILVVGLVLAVFSGRASVYSENYSDRLRFWQTAVENDPTRSNFYSVLGRLYYDEKEMDKAEEMFLKAIDLSVRNDPLNYRNLGVIYREEERLEEARSILERGVAVTPDSPDLQRLLGQTYYDLEEWELAERHLSTAVELDPSSIQAYITLVGIHYREGEIAEAVEACRKVLEIDPDHFHALNILGSLYRSMDEMDKAAGMWSRIIRIRPDHLPAYESLMHYHMERGNWESARNYALEFMKRGGIIDAETMTKLGL